jgi:hypothetical protein
MSAVEKAVKFARDTNDLAAMLAALTAEVRLIRLQHAIRAATLAS